MLAGLREKVIDGFLGEAIIGTAPATLDRSLHLTSKELVHPVEIILDGAVNIIQCHAVRTLPLPL